MRHKEALLEALENLGWPVSYEDVKLLEDEILTALTYIQQASDLQEIVKKETQKNLESYISNNKKVIHGKGFFPFRYSSSLCTSGIFFSMIIDDKVYM